MGEGVRTIMPSNFLDLHIVDVCQLNCRHCYLNKSNRIMPLDMFKAICEDFPSNRFSNAAKQNYTEWWRTTTPSELH